MLVLPRAAYDRVVDHARRGAPAEVCGLLGGRVETDDDGERVARVEALREATNAADDPETVYRIDPGEQFELVEAIEDDGHEVVGFYHSHPRGPTVPSETDADRATWPGLSYAIACLDGAPYVGSWRWTGADFEQEAVRVVSGHGPGSGPAAQFRDGEAE
ncbi:MAG: desampylase [Halobacteriaceae archaeon]